MTHASQTRFVSALHALAWGVLAVHVWLVVRWPAYQALPIGQTLGAFFKQTCHQIPERSLYVGGEPMPLCARCFGMTLGLALASAWMVWKPIASRSALRISGALLALMSVDWLMGVAGVVPDAWNVWRMAIGVLGGCGVYVLFATAAMSGVFSFWSSCNALRSGLERHAHEARSPGR